MNVLRRLSGTVVWNSGDRLLLSTNDRLRLSDDQGQSFRLETRLPVPFSLKIKMMTRLGQRLYRTAVRQVIEIDDQTQILFIGNRVFRYDLHDGQLHLQSELPRFPPLRVAWDGQRLLFGEYFNNKERQSVRVWWSDDLGKSWRVCYEFTTIRHVHGAIYDAYDKCFWITTGDYEQEAAIWKMEFDLNSIDPVIQGDQTCRAIDLLVYEDNLIYGTDSPLVQNELYELNKRTLKRKKLCDVGGSVFYCNDVAGNLFFTTAVEPSDFNSNDHAEVWMRAADADATDWNLLCSFQKDFWHTSIFQFGQVRIPFGQGTTDGIWVTPFATRFDQTSMLIGF